MPQRLALFDLDNTLLGGDSDHAWGEFLIARGLADRETHSRLNDQYYEEYTRGVLDIHAYVKFTMAPVLHMTVDELAQLHKEFLHEFIKPLVLPKALELVAGHHASGDCCVIVTATNGFITSPIARLFDVHKLLATELEQVDGHFTGNISGTPCFQDGKLSKLQDWLDAGDTGLSLDNSICYTDSINDLPLLQRTSEAVAVDPDETLRKTAEDRGWRVLSLRD